MSKLTKAELIAENARLRGLLADWAHQSSVDRCTIKRLRNQQPDVIQMEGIRNVAQRYCAEHGLKSVSVEQLKSEGLIP